MIVISAINQPNIPFDLFQGVITSEQDFEGIPYPWEKQIGTVGQQIISEIDEKNNVIKVDIFWKCNGEFYTLIKELDLSILPKLPLQDFEIRSLIFGFFANGVIVVWYQSLLRSYIIVNEKGALIKMFSEEQKNQIEERLAFRKILDQPENMVIQPTVDYKFFCKYCYRYNVQFEDICNEQEHKETCNCELGSLEEKLSDGTYNLTNDKCLLNYHKSAKPSKIVIKFKEYNDEYKLAIWLEYNLLLVIFEKFYGAHPETKTDFIIRIDAENKKYELALYRQGLKEPVVIPESAYQLIVFKNKFEDYRSENYNQPRGAWIW